MEITRITIQETNCYLLRGAAGTVLIDPGPTNAAPTIINQAAAQGIRPEEVKLILVTHGHMDHYGSAPAIQAWCQAPIAAHPQAPVYSQDKRNALPPAQTLRGSMVRWFYLLLSPVARFAPLAADLSLDEADSLQAYGVDAHIMHVPGHSPDSLALMTAGGESFVGDLFTNYAVPSQPLYLWNRTAWQQSYQKLKELAPQTVYVGHGDPFSGEKLAHIYPPRYQWRWWVR